MKIFLVDIAGTVDEYTSYLMNSLIKMKSEDDNITLYCPRATNVDRKNWARLLSLIPEKHKRSLSSWKRNLKVVEALMNYVYLILAVVLKRPNVVHLQWFPFLQRIPIEKFFLRMIKLLSSQTKVVYTHHNLYPHEIKYEEKAAYNRKFRDIVQYVDLIIVHTKTTKLEVSKEFDVPLSSIEVCYHGIFYPTEEYNESYNNDGKYKILMFGMQEPYKGTDLLVNAIDTLSDQVKKNIKVEIVGRMQEGYLKTFEHVAQRNNILINPYRISNKELYEKIVGSDFLVYPYRRISQSGALLLGLYFNKPILASDLPPFIETLDGFETEWFFKSESTEDLARLITDCVSGRINLESQLQCIGKLKDIYSWDSVAKSTLLVYKNILQKGQRKA